jgi:hypothetical protein
MEFGLYQQKITIFLFLFVLLLFNTNIAKAGSVLEEHIDKQRVLLIFSPRESDKNANNLIKQSEKLEAELKDRDLVIYKVVNNSGVYSEGRKINAKPSSFYSTLNAPYNIFSVVLVCKDGGIKYRSEDEVSMKDILKIIDKMPGRIKELEQKAASQK